MSPIDPPQPPRVDPALLRGLTQSRHSRRDMLRLLGMGAGAVGAGSILSACGVSGQSPSAGSSPSNSKSVADAAASYWQKKQKTGQVNWANWPLYIDTAGKGNHPSINQFEKQYGIKVNYSEVIQDNPSFFATIRPTLQAGQYTGYDTAVISDGQILTELMQLGYLVPLDQSRLTNFKKYAGAKFRNPDYDPGNTYTIPWQAGFTGLAYDPAKTGREITSFQDLLDPKFKGKIGMFADASELGNAGMFALGINAEKSTPSDWKKSADWLNKVKPNVRKYYEQDYVHALVTGDVWLTQAWSGDIFQSNLSGSNLKFVIPKEGGLLWTDNFLILKGAQNPVDAMMLMDYYYQPDKAAEVAEWVNYITPVPKAQQVVLSDAKSAKKPSDAKYLRSVAHSYAVFPTAKTYSQVSTGRTLKVNEIQTWNNIFDPIFQS